ncbi:hypothetical protein NC652_007941 [Populus alba x Populus x berolinensis]|nr:hypothetical protein NC652_007941 [Populus alba x Populus x berolinensis]
MEIFTKQLTRVDLEKGLVLPPRSNLEHRELSTIVESSAGTRSPESIYN